MNRYRLRTLIAVPMLFATLSLPAFAQMKRQDVKDHPPASGEAAKAKEKALPATKQMDDASSVEKTGIPERGAAGGKPTHPPTKQMDKAASPEKTQ